LMSRPPLLSEEGNIAFPINLFTPSWTAPTAEFVRESLLQDTSTTVL
jgi:hypothetical protein